MKIVKVTALSVFLIAIVFVLIMSNLTKNSFTAFQFQNIMENIPYDLDFIKQEIDNPQEFLLSLEEQSEIVLVGEVVELKKFQGVLFYEIKIENTDERFLLFSNGNLSYSYELDVYKYDTNYHYKPLFIGYKYIFFLQKFTDVSVFTNGKTIYQLSGIQYNGDKFNRYYSVYNVSDETIILNDYEDVSSSNNTSDYVKGFTFQEIQMVDIYYQKGIGIDQIDNYIELKQSILNKYWAGINND